MNCDRAQIARMVRLLHPQPDALWELRVLPDRGPHAGYYNDLEKFVADAATWSGRGHCYLTLNVVHPDCAARILNRNVWAKRDTLTKDKEIVGRTAILLDFDPRRLTGIASTEDEHEAAIGVARAVRSSLGERGWPEPILMSSGNGAYLLYRCELPADDGGLVNRFVKTIADRFDSERVKIDTSVHNASRIARVAGTLNMKGESTVERPHRLATILEAPEALQAVSTEALSAVVGVPSPATEQLRQANGNLFDVATWLTRHDVPFDIESADDGIRYRLGVCPFKGHGHEDGRTWIFQRNDGRIVAGCHHAKCGKRGWKDLRLRIDASFDIDVEDHLGGSSLERPNDCHRFARVILADTRHADGNETFALEGDTLYRWSDIAWQPLSEACFTRVITEASKAEADRLAIGARNRGLDGFALNVTVNFVNSVRNAMLSMMPHATSQPSWLANDRGWLANEVLACADGLIHLPSFADGCEEYRMPLTPQFFSTLNLGYPFDPNGKPPTLWFEFLNQIWETDSTSVLLLQEWLGYLLTLDTSMQKMLILFGAGGGGKGTILEVTRQLIGAANVTSLKLPDLAESHATQTLIGKSLCIFPDAAIPQRMDKTPLVETIKSITGEDLISVNPKNKARYATKLNTRLMVATNNLLGFDDPSGAIDRRLLVLRFTKSFEKSADKNLRGKLLKELPGILLWAIDGWKRLNEQGHFTEAESGKEVKTRLRETSSPVLTFVTECCEVGPNAVVSKDVLFSAWKTWCAEYDHDPGVKDTFAPLLMAAVPAVKCFRPRVNGDERAQCYKGIRLKAALLSPFDCDFSWVICAEEEVRQYIDDVAELLAASWAAAA